jgi:DNA-directed RNA polymerase alpha subunit
VLRRDSALRKGGYKTVKDLSQATREEVSKVKNLGGKSVNTVIEKLEEKGVSIKG